MENERGYLDPTFDVMPYRGRISVRIGEQGTRLTLSVKATVGP